MSLNYAKVESLSFVLKSVEIRLKVQLVIPRSDYPLEKQSNCTKSRL